MSNITLEVKNQLVNALQDLLELCPPPNARKIVIRDYYIKNGACDRRVAYEANGTPFKPNPFTAFKAIGRLAAAKPGVTSHDQVRAAMRELMSVHNPGKGLVWLQDYLGKYNADGRLASPGCGPAERARIANRSIQWLSALQQCEGAGPIAEMLPHQKRTISFNKYGLNFDATVDFYFGDHTIVHVGQASEAGRDLAAYIFMVGMFANSAYWKPAEPMAGEATLVDPARRIVEVMGFDEILERGPLMARRALAAAVQSKSLSLIHI